MGLIGGSLSKGLRKSGFDGKIIVVDSNEEHCRISLARGLADQCLPLGEAVVQSDLVLLCAPVDSNCSLLPEILDGINGSKTVVADMGSTKADIAALVEQHPQRGRYVAVHPMAGTEFSGPYAAKEGLFEGRVAIICDREKSDEDAFQLVLGLLSSLKMKTLFMNSVDHDIHVAYVSHISHISSFALALSVLDKEKDEKNILSLAAGGFESTVRLAKSNSETWAPIFLQNANPVVEVIDNYIEKVMLFRQYITENNSEGLIRLMKEANAIVRILN
jgi:prephenate dehydrogenase